MIDYGADGLIYTALTKGDYISLDVIRIITGLDPGENHDLYKLAMLKIREKIWTECKFFCAMRRKRAAHSDRCGSGLLQNKTL
jgi:hypothetical protein